MTFDQINQNYTSTKLTAENPSPADGAEDVSVDQILSWTVGPLADTVDVYFGTNFDAVNSRDGSVFKGNQSWPVMIPVHWQVLQLTTGLLTL